jgi:hypothetical protein
MTQRDRRIARSRRQLAKRKTVTAEAFGVHPRVAKQQQSNTGWLIQ